VVIVEDASNITIHHTNAVYCAVRDAGIVTLFDKSVSFLLNKMEDLDLLEEAAVIFTSDRDFHHGGMGGLENALP